MPKTNELDWDKLYKESQNLNDIIEENQILWALLGMPQSAMDDKDHQHWYKCVQKALAAHNADKKGVDITLNWDESPEGYNGPCMCKLCRSYGD